YAEAIARHGCTRVAAVTTEAVRKAANGGDFVARASEALAKVGGRMEVIDGEREARLCWRAVSGAFPSLAGPRTVVDIGGGSTELIVGERAVEGVISLPIGSVRLTERCVAHDPATNDDAARLAATVDEALTQAPPLRGPLVAKKRMPGLDPKRADVIYAGAVILARVMARTGAAECIVSDRGIRWGLI